MTTEEAMLASVPTQGLRQGGKCCGRNATVGVRRDEDVSAGKGDGAGCRDVQADALDPCASFEYTLGFNFIRFEAA